MHHSRVLFSSTLICNLVTHLVSKTFHFACNCLIKTHVDAVPSTDNTPGPDMEKLCETPLQAAAYKGDIERLEELILPRTDVNGTALQAACYSGQLPAAELLLKSGANANSASGIYGPPVYIAACNGYAELIGRLIMYGADINAKGGVYGNALVAAAIGGH